MSGQQRWQSLGLDDDLVKADEVGDINLIERLALVDNAKRDLSAKRHAGVLEFTRQSLLVDRFKETMANLMKNRSHNLFICSI